MSVVTEFDHETVRLLGAIRSQQTSGVFNFPNLGPNVGKSDEEIFAAAASLDDLIEDFGDRPGTGQPFLMQLTPRGYAAIKEIDRRRHDPVLRRAAARRQLLRWTYDQRGSVNATVEDFTNSPARMFLGEFLAAEEIDEAVEYLRGEGLIVVDGATDALWLRIAHAGKKCVEAYGGDVAAWGRQTEGKGVHIGQLLNNSGVMSNVNAIGNTGTQGNINQGVAASTDPAAVLDWLAVLSAALPSARLPEAELAQVQSAIADLQNRVEFHDAPEAVSGAGRRVVELLRHALTLGGAANIAAILSGVIDVGQALFGSN